MTLNGVMAIRLLCVIKLNYLCFRDSHAKSIEARIDAILSRATIYVQRVQFLAM